MIWVVQWLAVLAWFSSSSSMNWHATTTSWHGSCLDTDLVQKQIITQDRGRRKREERRGGEEKKKKTREGRGREKGGILNIL